MYFEDFLNKNYLWASKLDIIIFGATGHMGRRTVSEAVELLRDFSWGIAGRNREKLESLLRDVSRKTKVNLCKIPIFIADISDPVSLGDLMIRCNVVVNCCGPYQLLGEPVIKACIQTGAHYVDLSMEPHNTELMQLKYHEEARNQNVYIVSACGWESMPIEIGINYLQKNFSGTINYIESYVEYKTTYDDLFMPLGSDSAWKSIVLSCANFRKIPAIREQLHPEELPDLKPRSAYKGLMHETDIVSGVCVPFPVIDQQVVERSQYYFYEQEQKRPIQFQNYLAFSNHIAAVVFYIWCFFISLLAQIPVTREILLKFPSLFSFGCFSDKGPSNKSLDKTFFKITMHAVGWERTVKKPTYEFEDMPNKSMTITINGVNPLYGVACVCLLASAITIIEDSASMPDGGGVYSPGAAFANTNIIEVLQRHENGLTLDITQN